MIMKQYIIDIDLPEQMDDEFVRMIPMQRQHINLLMQEGIITSYSLALDRSKLWVTIIAKNENEVASILKTFPLIHYFVYSIHELAFHNATTYSMPPISLN
jgi:muconolactone delta-isomerase